LLSAFRVAATQVF